MISAWESGETIKFAPQAAKPDLATVRQVWPKTQISDRLSAQMTQHS